MINKTKEIYRHGELILKSVDKIPNGAILQEEVNRKIIAFSETHHHHVLQTKEKTDLSKFKVFTWNGETYLEVPEVSELLHEKSGKDAHKTHEIKPSIYKVVIKKEFDYFKGLIRQVRD